MYSLIDNQMQATARIFYQKAPAKRTKDDLCPVKLCITHKQVRKYYSLAEVVKESKWLFLSENDIKRVSGDSPRGKYREIADEYKRITDEARKAINGITTFSFNQFEDRFFQKMTSWDNFFSAAIDYTSGLKNEGRLGYASSFESTIRAVKEFHEDKKLKYNCRDKIETRTKDYLASKPLYFVDITPTWLRGFEQWLIKDGKSKSTIGIYTRNIRVLFNHAIKFHRIAAEYPFSTYKPKTARGRKIALTAEQISKLANFETEHPREVFYRDIFMFSFLGNGMNLSDIARLKYSNIIDGEISFVREKTKSEETEEDWLNAPITKTMSSIIDKHGNKAIGFDSYIFPILKQEWNEERKYAEIKQLTKQVNKCLRHIASKSGIKDKISSYTARHSWATISKNTGKSTEFISESLGHSSVIVTKRYLKSFEKSAREEHSDTIEKTIYTQNVV